MVKLREIRATEYKSYGALRDCSEALLRMLINQMIQEGYLRQTENMYSVLRLGREIYKLHDENTRVIVRMYEEKSGDKSVKVAKAENFLNVGKVLKGEEDARAESALNGEKISNTGKISGTEKASKRRKADVLTSAGSVLFERLRALRLEIAREEAVPPYIVFSDKTLIDMCVKLPRTEAEMLQVNGVGEHKLKRYGHRSLAVIESCGEV